MRTVKLLAAAVMGALMLVACVAETSIETGSAGLTEQARWQEPPWYGDLNVFATARDTQGYTSYTTWELAWTTLEQRAAELRMDCDRVGGLFGRSSDRPQEVPGEGYSLLIQCVPPPFGGAFAAAPVVDGAVAETAWWHAPPWYKDLRLYASGANDWERAWLALEELSRGYQAQCASVGGRFAQRPGATPYLWERSYAGYFFWIDCFPSEQAPAAAPDPEPQDEGGSACDCDTTWGCDECWCEPAGECE